MHTANDVVSTAAAVMSPLGGFHEPIPRPVTRSTSVALFGVTWMTASTPGKATLVISMVCPVRVIPGRSPGDSNVKEASERDRRNVAVLVVATRYAWLLQGPMSVGSNDICLSHATHAASKYFLSGNILSRLAEPSRTANSRKEAPLWMMFSQPPESSPDIVAIRDWEVRLI
jgi:hypothetical protein